MGRATVTFFDFLNIYLVSESIDSEIVAASSIVTKTDEMQWKVISADPRAWFKYSVSSLATGISYVQTECLQISTRC